jgi:hypothetical protein
MAVEIKTHRDHPSSMAERINKRLRNSGDTANADHVVQNGSGPTRVFHNVHDGGSAKRHGQPNVGEGSIDGGKRTVV